jgi:hypothetical protein
LERRHSTIAVACATWYADPFWLNRKLDTEAARVLYAAVVQNSRKWKVERAVMKKGRRQRGESVKARRAIVAVREEDRTKPQASARRAIPERDLDWPG